MPWGKAGMQPFGLLDACPVYCSCIGIGDPERIPWCCTCFRTNWFESVTVDYKQSSVHLSCEIISFHILVGFCFSWEHRVSFLQCCSVLVSNILIVSSFVWCLLRRHVLFVLSFSSYLLSFFFICHSRIEDSVWHYFFKNKASVKRGSRSTSQVLHPPS
jgi:hypothetical protein